jgi:ERF superfamily protein
MSTELVQRETAAPSNTPDDLFAVVARAAMSPDVDPGKMRELLAMRKELEAEKAAMLFNQAMAGFQSEVPILVKSRGVPDRTGRVAYKYSPIEEVEVHIKPLEGKYGFRHSFPRMENTGGMITAVCRVTHSAGHSEDSSCTYRLSTKTGIMSDTQQDAATETFCKRRALCNAYGLTLAGEDFDGAGRVKPTGPSALAADDAVKPLAQELWNLLKEVRGTAKNWDMANSWLWREEILDAGNPDDVAPNLSAKRFREVIAATKKRLSA